MAMILLLKKGIRKQMSSIAGIFILFFMISISLVMAFAARINSDSYLNLEMERLGYGDVTAWVSNVDDMDSLTEQIIALNDIDKVNVQPLLFSDYTIKEMRSDNEGQLIAYDPEIYSYKFLNDSLTGYADINSIKQGEIYVSPSMKSVFGVEIGDEIQFSLSRLNDNVIFIVKGYFEDPFMGSSMIDVKSFLINPNDFEEISAVVSHISDFNVLSRRGAMLHIFQSPDSKLSPSDLNGIINEHTELGRYKEFVYSYASIMGFMLILQNIFTGFLSAFAVILTAVSMIVIGHSISISIEQDFRDMGVLKTAGCTSFQLQALKTAEFTLGILSGMAVALLFSKPCAIFISRLTITSTGLYIPSNIPYGLCLLVFAALLCILAAFICLQTTKIASISPVQTMIYEENKNLEAGQVTGIIPEMLIFSLAIRQVASSKGRYAKTCIISLLLVFFVSAVGRMSIWLGPDGEGLMNAFSAADHDLGVQPVSNVEMKKVEDIIAAHSDILSTYELAMQDVTVNGVDYTANVIDDPFRFHILSGRTCTRDNEIVITKLVAADLNIKAGDTVTVSKGSRTGDYMVAGIYQCANEMGGNIGIFRDGYARIGNINENIWCRHYILADSTANDVIMNELQQAYRMELSIHTNSWSGLDSIVDTIHFLIYFMYAVVVLFITVVISLTGSRLLLAEQKDMAVLKSIGFSSSRLRLTFALRFGIVAAIGSALGSAVSCLLSDYIIASLLKMFGIGEFHSNPNFVEIILPAVAVTLIFTAFAYLMSRRIRAVLLKTLLN